MGKIALVTHCTLTCAIGTRNVTKLLVGTKEGSVISSYSNFVFCCDADKNVFRFDTDSENTYQIETRKNVKLNFSI